MQQDVAGGPSLDRLDLSVKTVESYRARLMSKLGLHNRAELTRLAVESGILVTGSDDDAQIIDA